MILKHPDFVICENPTAEEIAADKAGQVRACVPGTVRGEELGR